MEQRFENTGDCWERTVNGICSYYMEYKAMGGCYHLFKTKAYRLTEPDQRIEGAICNNEKDAEMECRRLEDMLGSGVTSEPTQNQTAHSV